MPNSPISQDPRAVVADIAVDIEASAMRAHEKLNGRTPYSMSCPQFKLAGMALQIAALARAMRDEIASTYPPAPAPRKPGQ